MIKDCLHELSAAADVDKLQRCSEVAVCIYKLIDYCNCVMKNGTEQEKVAAAKALIALTAESSTLVEETTYDH
jgi:hypothetical protein